MLHCTVCRKKRGTEAIKTQKHILNNKYFRIIKINIKFGFSIVFLNSFIKWSVANSPHITLSISQSTAKQNKLTTNNNAISEKVQTDLKINAIKTLKIDTYIVVLFCCYSTNKNAKLRIPLNIAHTLNALANRSFSWYSCELKYILEHWQNWRYICIFGVARTITSMFDFYNFLFMH